MTIDWCVLWFAESKTLAVCQKEQMLNLNANALMDKVCGGCPVRMDLTYEQAQTYADAMRQTLAHKCEAEA